MSAKTTRKVICLACGVEQELELDQPCKNCGPADDCLETIEVYPWYNKPTTYREEVS